MVLSLHNCSNVVATAGRSQTPLKGKNTKHTHTHCLIAQIHKPPQVSLRVVSSWWSDIAIAV